MLYSSLLIFSSLSIVSAGLSSFVILYFSYKKINHSHNASLRQYSLAFFLLIWIRVPVVTALAGIPLRSTVTELIPVYFISFVVLIIAYLLFYRGVMMLLSTSKFWCNTFPLLIFVVFTSLLFVFQFWFEISMISVINIVSISSYIVILFLIATAVRSLSLRSSVWNSTWFIIIGWTVLLMADIHLVQIVHNYPSEFWFFALTSLPTAYIYLGFTVAHFFLLFGFILHYRGG